MTNSFHSQENLDHIMEHVVHHVPFEGWTFKALIQGVQEAGYEPSDAHRAFKGDISQAIDYFFAMTDRRMLEEIAKIDFPHLRVRDRISTAVMLRLALLRPHREAVRVTLTTLSHPARAADGLKYLTRTVSAIWYAAGDTATDFNYYSKRALISGVYASTLLKWLDDESLDNVETRAFLEKRISQVMTIPKMKAKAKDALDFICAFPKKFWKRAS